MAPAHGSLDTWYYNNFLLEKPYNKHLGSANCTYYKDLHSIMYRSILLNCKVSWLSCTSFSSVLHYGVLLLPCSKVTWPFPVLMVVQHELWLFMSCRYECINIPPDSLKQRLVYTCRVGINEDETCVYMVCLFQENVHITFSLHSACMSLLQLLLMSFYQLEFSHFLLPFNKYQQVRCFASK